MPPIKFDDPRKVEINYNGLPQIIYPSNFIKTSKYNAVTFLPFSLIGQFRRYANIYFLFIAIIQSISIISPLNPATAILPLIFVLGLSMLREGFEDYKRHRSDQEVNSSASKCIREGKLVNYTWADVQVGDLIIVDQDEMFPADIVVLGSNLENGVCYIETSQLDGEKNLKPKSSIKETAALFKERISQQTEKLVFGAKKPEKALDSYDGNIEIQAQLKALNSKQLLLRGAFLRNTQWIIGIVIYTGEDTKILRNSEPGRIKQSCIERQMNQLILGILMIQLILCLISAIMSSWWINSRGINHWYVWQKDWSPSGLSTIAFFSYFLLYNTMIPISLVVSLEFVKVFQIYFIMCDEDMYSPLRGKYVSAQTSTINEELGQVEYVFSDKTGTLTCNQMEFKYCIVGDILYGQNDNHIVQEEEEQEVVEEQEEEQKQEEQKLQKDNKPKQIALSVFNFKDKILTGIIQGNNLDQANHPVNYAIQSDDAKSTLNFKIQKHLIDQYFLLLASAHECIAQKNEETGKIVYQGPSPDEITLVDAAMNMGYQFVNSSASTQEFKIHNIQKKVELLNIFEFNSDRKRMSVIIRDPEDGLIKMFIKGADNIIKSRLNPINQPFLKFIDHELSEFSKIGLRTLCMAMKIFSESEYEQVYKDFNDACNSNEREKKVNEFTDRIERNLCLIGATAVEDKLQDQVPETIADLLKANIKVWMLTGDKLETAENIAKSCRLIQGDMSIFRLSENNLDSLRDKLSEIREAYDLCIKQKKSKSFLVEGQCLFLITQHEDVKKSFVRMAQNCDSVVCCRVTPSQKKDVVSLIKKELNKITLSIGDGANDVSMIKEADIGIGLYGNEGMSAVQSSDFALGEFRCLWRLLLVHGHWSYIRISEMILYFFYKNMLLTIPQFFFAFYSGFSGQSFFDDWYISFYNLFFTALPLVIRATFDQDINYKQLINSNYDGERLEFINKKEKYLKSKFPYLYYIGQQQTIFTLPNFIAWWGQGFVHGLLVFFITLGCFNDEILNDSGIPGGLATVSITAYTAIIFIVDMKIALYTKFWTFLNFIALLLLSIGIYILYFIISHYISGTFSQATPIYLLETSHFYLICILLTAFIFLFDLGVNVAIRELFVTELDKMKKFKQYLSYFIHSHHLKDHRTSKKNLILREIEKLQLQKQEQGAQREWGDSFFEQIVEEQHQQLRQNESEQDLDMNQQQQVFSMRPIDQQEIPLNVEIVNVQNGQQQEIIQVNNNEVEAYQIENIEFDDLGGSQENQARKLEETIKFEHKEQTF